MIVSVRTHVAVEREVLLIDGTLGGVPNGSRCTDPRVARDTIQASRQNVSPAAERSTRGGEQVRTEPLTGV